MFIFKGFNTNLLKNMTKTKINQIYRTSYTAVPYDNKRDPRPLFFNKHTQKLLRDLTRLNTNEVFRRKKLGQKKIEDAEYKFMTDEELRLARLEAFKKLDFLLQIPPAVPIRQPISRIFSKDSELQGLLNSKIVFTDITFGVKNKDRLITVREIDGTLKEADWEIRRRMNQIYFPKKGRSLKPPLLFQNEYFQSLLERGEYLFILDNACVQFEPDDPQYQTITSITYQHLNDHEKFDCLRSTRHFGALTFFLAFNDIIDKLLVDLLKTANLGEVDMLLDLYSTLNNVHFEKNEDSSLNNIENYIKNYSKMKSVVELAFQAYKDLKMRQEEINEGIKIAHGID